MSRLFGTSGIRGVYGKEVTVALATDVGSALATTLKGKKVSCRQGPAEFLS